MRLTIYDVEHGACALLTADNGTRLMIDCGHNSTNDWYPGTHLWQQGVGAIDMLAVTNFDEDHASGAPDLFARLNVAWLTRNPSLTPQNIRAMKTEFGMGPGVTRLVQALTTHSNPPGPTSPLPTFYGLDWSTFYVNYPTFTDTNNLSMVLFLKCHEVGVMFTGDLEQAGFRELLKNPGFQTALQQTNVYIASHHGRESGCSDEAARFLTNVVFVVISDKGYEHETQNTIAFYRNIARGGGFRGETRYVLTTRNDRAITFGFTPGQWTAG